jgi:hypothetical protein
VSRRPVTCPAPTTVSGDLRVVSDVITVVSPPRAPSVVPLSRRGDSQAVSANENNPTALSLAKERRRVRSEGGVSVSDDGQDRSRDMVSSLGRQHLIALPFAVSIDDGPVGADELCLLLDPNAVDRAIHAGRRVTLAGRNAPPAHAAAGRRPSTAPTEDHEQRRDQPPC